jgi:carbonic anhydrase
MAEGQSPVDIPPGAPVRRVGLELRYGSIPLLLGREPTAVHVDNSGEMAAVIEGHSFALAQVHMHCPSEHTFSGTHTPMELHLVHQSHEGRVAVVGITFVEGRANPGLDAIIAALDRDDAPPTLDLRALVPADHAHVAYDGSLTTPPFTEGVAWRVLVRPGTLSSAQLGALQAVHGRNARPVQPMGERTFQ